MLNNSKLFTSLVACIVLLKFSEIILLFRWVLEFISALCNEFEQLFCVYSDLHGEYLVFDKLIASLDSATTLSTLSRLKLNYNWQMIVATSEYFWTGLIQSSAKCKKFRPFYIQRADYQSQKAFKTKGTGRVNDGEKLAFGNCVDISCFRIGMLS